MRKCVGGMHAMVLKSSLYPSATRPAEHEQDVLQGPMPISLRYPHFPHTADDSQLPWGQYYTGDRSKQTDQTHGKDQVCETYLAIVRAPRHELDRHLSVLSHSYYHFRELDKPWPASAITSQSSARPSIRFTKSALARSRAATASYSFFFSSNLFIAAALTPCGAKDAACDLRFGAMECRIRCPVARMDDHTFPNSAEVQ